MTFLTPIPMAIALALGVPALLALYVLKLRRRPVRVSSVLLWAEAAEDLEANVPFRRLRASLTLLMQLLALVCLALALGRPVLGDRPEPARRVALVVDASASMSATDMVGSATRLDVALERARAIARDALRDGRGRVFIVQLDASPRLVGPAADSFAGAERLLAQITPTDQAGDVAAALRLCESVLAPRAEDEGGGATNDANPGVTHPDVINPDVANRDEIRSVVLLSDGGDAPGRALALAGASFVFERVAPEDDTQTTNIAIDAIGATRELSDPANALVLVRLLSTRADATRAVLLLDRTLAPGVASEAVERVAVTIPPTTDDGPGTASHTFELRDPRSFLARVSFVHESLASQSDLASDDQAAVIVPSARRPAVLVVSPDRDGVPEPDPILAAVLAELDLSALQFAREGGFDPASLMRYGYDLVVYDRVSPTINPPLPSLHLGSLPAGLPAPDAPERTTTAVLDWRRTHPTLRGVALDAVRIAERWVLPERPPAGFDALRVLADGTEGPLIVEVEQDQLARLVVGFDPMRSSWPVQPGYTVFLAAAIDHLAPSGVVGGGRAFRADEPAWARLDGAGRSGTDPTVLILPDGSRREIDSTTRAGDGAQSGRIALGVLGRAGVYAVEGGTDAQAFAPVNVADTGESTLMAPTTIRVAGREVERGDAAGVPEAPRELWPWLAATAFALLCAEWMVFARSTRLRG